MIDLPAMINECTTFTDTQTIESIIYIESKGDPYVIHDNTTGRSYRLSSYSMAVSIAHSALKKGHNIDLGLMQINSRNLPALDLTVDEVLDPCTNIEAGGTILNNAYLRAIKMFGAGHKAILQAVSAYNTGSLRRGFNNGYVTLVMAKLHVLQSASLEQMLD